MKINKVILTNIGPYEGRTIFDLSTSSGKNIVLIGGNNGSGKTTLLNAIKIGLYGSHSMGLMTITEKYIEKVTKLLNKNSIQSGNTEFSVEIEYLETRNFKENRYSIKRIWKKNKNINERVEFKKNGSKKSKEAFENYFSRLKESTSVELLNSMMFDGEKIARIIESGEINEFIKNIINSTYSLNLFNTINSDIYAYIQKEKDNSTLTIEELAVFEQKNRVIAKENHMKNLYKSKEERQKQQNDLVLNKGVYLEKYKSLGGLDDDELFDFQSSLKDNETIKKQLNKKLINYLDNNFALSINVELLKLAKQKIIKEYPVQALKMIDLVRENHSKQMDETEYKLIVKSLQKLQNGPVIHNVDKETYDLINKKIIEIKKFENNIKYRKSFSLTKETQISLGDLKKDLLKSEEIELKSLYSEINDLNSNIEKISEEIIEIESKISIISIELVSEKDKYYQLEDKMDMTKRTSSSFNIASKIIEINNKFVEEKRNIEISKIENLITKYFNEVTYKKPFVKEIEINKDSFELVVTNIHNKKMDVSSFSAGEKQILMGCLIKSLYETSMRKLPIIFDTPLARLDSKNRLSFVKKIISESAEQVIILSTDKEIIGDTYEVLKNRINRRYLLSNNGKQSTKVTKSYFKEA